MPINRKEIASTKTFSDSLGQVFLLDLLPVRLGAARLAIDTVFGTVGPCDLIFVYLLFTTTASESTILYCTQCRVSILLIGRETIKPEAFPGIIGYSDDDRSDDEVKRPSPTKPRSKDSLLRKSVSTPVLKVPPSTEQTTLDNVSLKPHLVGLCAYGRGAPLCFRPRLAPLRSETGTEGS
jgi:hypothetical protein